MKDYITRKIVKKYNQKYTYKYFDKDNNSVKDSIVKCYLEGLYIPPAHDNVKINLNKKDKILAIGYDTKNRAQYVYNKEYVKKQSEKKFNHMIEFGESYQKILKQINKDLYLEKDTKEKQIAMILKLVIDCSFRIGNDKYTKDNQSYGVSTLETKHIKIKKSSVNIDFIGKKGVRNQCTVKNKRLIRNLKNKKRTLHKNDRLFSYRNKHKYYPIQSKDVNKYLQKFGKFSTKNFRTWGANIKLIQCILNYDLSIESSIKQKQEMINQCIQKVADKLHNTKSVCKSNYIDPLLLETILNDTRYFLSVFQDCKSDVDYTIAYIHFLKQLLV